jgi:hypothetical protein
MNEVVLKWWRVIKLYSPWLALALIAFSLAVFWVLPTFNSMAQVNRSNAQIIRVEKDLTRLDKVSAKSSNLELRTVYKDELSQLRLLESELKR